MASDLPPISLQSMISSLSLISCLCTHILHIIDIYSPPSQCKLSISAAFYSVQVAFVCSVFD